MACLRFPEGSLLPFSVGLRAKGNRPRPSAGQAPLAKAEASRPHYLQNRAAAA